MTDKQTIDGVPRATLEGLLDPMRYIREPELREELRALLENPVFESQYDGMSQDQAQAVSDGVDEILHGKPASQPLVCATIRVEKINERLCATVARFDVDQLPVGSLINVYTAQPQGEVERLREELALVKNEDLKYRSLLEQEREIKALQQRLTNVEQKLDEAYEWGYVDGQRDPSGYSDKSDRDKCVTELTKLVVEVENSVNGDSNISQQNLDPVAWICHGPKGSGLVALQWSHLPPPNGFERKIPLRADYRVLP